MPLRLRYCKDIQLPVDVFRLARQHGITVYPRKLPWFVGGILYKYETEAYMYLNITHPLTRQRFTVAHEIAHYLLHPVGMYAENGKKGRMEREANALAAEILMPRRAVLECLKHGLTVPEMGRVFGVSWEAMDIRIQELTQRKSDSRGGGPSYGYSYGWPE